MLYTEVRQNTENSKRHKKKWTLQKQEAVEKRKESADIFITSE
jgi:hypothetical protein